MTTIRRKVTCKSGGKAGDREDFFTIGDAGVCVTLYLSPEQLAGIATGFGRARDIDVTIEPAQTREERLREARLSALVNNNYGYVASSGALSVIERVDAEFAKENG